MATESGKTAGDVTDGGSAPLATLRNSMHDQPFRFRFFQAMRLLEWMHPERRPVGLFGRPGEEVVRLSARPSLTFPASEIQSLEEQLPAAMEVNFMGLNTVNGPLPRAMTALVLERQRAKDDATASFHDIFNHRALSLFYRAWRRYRFFLEGEGKEGSETNEVTARLYDLVGMGTPGLRGRMAIPDRAAVFYAGLLSRQVRSVDGLAQILTEYFKIDVEVRQFTGAWEPLSRDQQTCLRESNSFAESLGRGAVLGDEVWNQAGALTIRLGPMCLNRYREFLPGRSAYRELHAWLQLYSRREFSFVVQLVLDRHEVPPVEMATEQSKQRRLGYESWLKVRPSQRDPDETTYVLQ